MGNWQQQLQIESTCDAFESLLRAQQSPQIEHYLERCQPADYEQLFKELLTLEIEYTQSNGSLPSIDTYLERFSDFPEIVTAVFRSELQKRGKFRDLNNPEVDTDWIAQANTKDDSICGEAHVNFRLSNNEFGDYWLVRRIGQGGMGSVFVAREKNTHRLVALKLIRPDRLNSVVSSRREELLQRFHTEALAAASLNHKNITPVYRVGQHGEVPFYVMQLIDGLSLDKKIALGPMQNRIAAEIGLKMAAAVQFAHDQGILHRDLKPSNVLLDKNHEPYVADFGLAKWCNGGNDLTATGDAIGTPSYTSPEQATNAAGVNECTDIYGIGATLYSMLTGKPPFVASDPLSTLNQVLESEPVAPRTINPDVHRDLETICLKCLEKSPRLRYQRSAEVADELQRVLDGRTIVARPAGMMRKSRAWFYRNPTVGSLAVMLVLVAVLGISGIVWQWNNAVINAEKAKEQADIANAYLLDATTSG